MGELESPDPSLLRVSDADRERVAEILREAAGAGRIDFEELDERLGSTYAAKTVGDLVPVTADLPVAASEAARRVPDRALADVASGPGNRVVRGPERSRHVAIMGGVERSGEWVVPAEMTVVAFWGGVDLDMRQAQFAAREVVVTVNVLMGGASITVDEHTRVVMEGMGIMGGYAGPSAHEPTEFDEDSVTLRVRGVAIMGGVGVQRKPRPLPPYESRKRLR